MFTIPSSGADLGVMVAKHTNSIQIESWIDGLRDTACESASFPTKDFRGWMAYKVFLILEFQSTLLGVTSAEHSKLLRKFVSTECFLEGLKERDVNPFDIPLEDGSKISILRCSYKPRKLCLMNFAITFDGRGLEETFSTRGDDGNPLEVFWQLRKELYHKAHLEYDTDKNRVEKALGRVFMNWV